MHSSNFSTFLFSKFYHLLRFDFIIIQTCVINFKIRRFGVISSIQSIDNLSFVSSLLIMTLLWPQFIHKAIVWVSKTFLWPLINSLFANKKQSSYFILSLGGQISSSSIHRKMFSWFIRDVDTHFQLSNANATIFKHNFIISLTFLKYLPIKYLFIFEIYLNNI